MIVPTLFERSCNDCATLEPRYSIPKPKFFDTSVMEPCKYCTDSDDIQFLVSGYVIEERKDNIRVSAFIHKSTMIFSANYITLEAPINFCPMCGRRLIVAEGNAEADGEPT